MTSLRQIEANRRNATRSTGPSTETGKDRSRRNAVRHGLTAETVIDALEDAEDYRRFEAAVTADFNPETAVERELVLRLASLLWRLRRAAAIETGMFQNSGEIMPAGDEAIPPERKAPAVVAQITTLRSPDSVEVKPTETCKNQAPLADCDEVDRAETPTGEYSDTLSHLAARFLNIAATDKIAFERLGRYETALWRQVWQTVFMLEVLRRQSLDMKWHPRASHQGGSRSFSMPLSPRR
jgi:hypothetical protein